MGVHKGVDGANGTQTPEITYQSAVKYTDDGAPCAFVCNNIGAGVC